MAADLIQVIREGTRVRIVVDGVEIPARAVMRHSCEVPVDPDEIPSLRLTLFGSRVEVLNSREKGATDGTAE